MRFIPLTKWTALATCLAFVACSSDPATFVTYTQQSRTATGAPPVTAAPRFTDALALNYANSVESIFRAKASGTRYTREASDTALAGLASATVAAGTFAYSASTVTGLGIAAAGIVQLQNIFNARARSTAYFEAATRIHGAIKDYVAFNLNRVSEIALTPNGWTLANVVQSNIDMVDKVLNGHLPTAEELAQATEPMSPDGATPQAPGTIPRNNISRNALLPAASPRRPRDLTAPPGVTSEVSEGVQRDQRRLAAWVFELENAKDFARMQLFLSEVGFQELVKDEDAANTIRRMIRGARAPETIAPLLKKAGLPPGTIPEPTPSTRKRTLPPVSQPHPS